jgi:putative phosphoribosyl transferase
MGQLVQNGAQLTARIREPAQCHAVDLGHPASAPGTTGSPRVCRDRSATARVKLGGFRAGWRTPLVRDAIGLNSDLAFGAGNGAGPDSWRVSAAQSCAPMRRSIAASRPRAGVMMIENRRQAGRALAEALSAYRGRPDVVVLALPRGGVPVAAEIAAMLDAPLDLILVRKLGVPGQPELAMGAIASNGACVMNRDVVRQLGIDQEGIDRAVARERQELERRDRAYRGDRAPVSVRDRCVIVVDDGVATGATLRAAMQAIRAQAPARLVVAVPVGAPETISRVEREADEVICLAQPQPFYAIGQWYRNFEQVSDDEVRQLLNDAWRRGGK